MNNILKTKLKFVVGLTVRHSEGGNRSLCRRLAMEHFDKLTCHPDDTVLYVGCGTGEEAVILATCVRSVLGIDADSSILEIATKDYPAENVEYLLDDLGPSSPNLVRWRESFSKVVCIDRVMFFPNLTAVVKNMVDCLKPGGELLCVIPNDDLNFFNRAAAVIDGHPEWAQRAPEPTAGSGAKQDGSRPAATLWRRTEEQTEQFFVDICEWSRLSCEIQRLDFSLSEDKAKMIWMDGIDRVERLHSSDQKQCLQAMWQWALGEYGCNEDGTLKKPSEFMVVYGVKKN